MQLLWSWLNWKGWKLIQNSLAETREKFQSDAQLSFFIGAQTRFFLPVLIRCLSCLFLFSSSEIVWPRVQVLLHFLWQEALIDYMSPIAEYSFQNATFLCARQANAHLI